MNTRAKNHIQSLLIILAITMPVLAIGAPAVKTPDKPTIEPIAITVSKTDPLKESPKDIKADPRAGSTEITFLARLGGCNIIAMDRDSSELTTFVDDKKQMLFKADAKSDLTRKRWLGSRPIISDDNHACAFTIEADRLPSKGAKFIIIDAAIAFICGSQPETISSTTALKVGSEFQMGSDKVKITAVKDTQWGQSKMSFSLSSSTDLRAINSISFLDSDGKPIGHSPMGSGKFTVTDQVTYTRSFGLHKKTDKITAKVEYFTKIETITIPLSAKLSVGL